MARRRDDPRKTRIFVPMSFAERSRALTRAAAADLPLSVFVRAVCCAEGAAPTERSSPRAPRLKTAISFYVSSAELGAIYATADRLGYEHVATAIRDLVLHAPPPSRVECDRYC